MGYLNSKLEASSKLRSHGCSYKQGLRLSTQIICNFSLKTVDIATLLRNDLIYGSAESETIDRS